jgi:hypothetical protein
MVFQAQQLQLQLNYLHQEIVSVDIRSESKNNYMDCRIFILTKGGDIAFTFQSPQF